MLLGLEGVLPLVATIAAGVAFAFAFAACARETHSDPPPPPPPSVAVDQIVARDVQRWDELVGRVEGAKVERGDVRFAIDPRPYRAALARATAAQARARARYR